ncbi:hypothetical protein RGCCGE502_08181 [Rhizobium grahamii CCGE 502]|uniref:Uncharacterized protein n=1 Tax=Rhizobium grahamii CCGE 502 TaxID=990285 RepID=S3I129_9HYPH|nr:hypothetical protein RGCCGE502_08181 [Rhizobium grahamii CCGE 502]
MRWRHREQLVQAVEARIDVVVDAIGKQLPAGSLQGFDLQPMLLEKSVTHVVEWRAIGLRDADSAAVRKKLAERLRGTEPRGDLDIAVFVSVHQIASHPGRVDADFGDIMATAR